jgi:choline dehydrogenase-like flavoprotein
MLYKQLHWPVPSKYSLHVVAEQTPRSENRIVLGDQKDALGMPIVSIDWRIGEPEMVTFRSFMRRFDAFWRKWRLDSIGKLVWVSRAHEFDLNRVQPESDVYHPAGTTSMSTSASSGVVDPDLTVFGVPNLSICSTSVFPTSGSANPTLTLMMLAARLAERLAQNAGQARVSS